MCKVTKSRAKCKIKAILFSFPRQSNFGEAKVTKSRAKYQIYLSITECRIISAKPKLRKKVVKAKRFWKINAIRPVIKAERGRMKNFNLGQIANWGGLVKEFGCKIVELLFSI